MGASLQGNMADLFVTYPRKDQALVRRMCEALKERGREAWVDWEDIPPSAKWRSEIEGAIEAAEMFVFVLSPDSVHSAVCAEEIRHAVDSKKRLIPLVYGPSDRSDRTERQGRTAVVQPRARIPRHRLRRRRRSPSAAGLDATGQRSRGRGLPAHVAQHDARRVGSPDRCGRGVPEDLSEPSLTPGPAGKGVVPFKLVVRQNGDGPDGPPCTMKISYHPRAPAPGHVDDVWYRESGPKLMGSS